jgi:hypothetical protein
VAGIASAGPGSRTFVHVAHGSALAVSCTTPADTTDVRDDVLISETPHEPAEGLAVLRRRGPVTLAGVSPTRRLTCTSAGPAPRAEPASRIRTPPAATPCPASTASIAATARHCTLRSSAPRTATARAEPGGTRMDVGTRRPPSTNRWLSMVARLRRPIQGQRSRRKRDVGAPPTRPSRGCWGTAAETVGHEGPMRPAAPFPRRPGATPRPACAGTRMPFASRRCRSHRWSRWAHGSVSWPGPDPSPPRPPRPAGAALPGPGWSGSRCAARSGRPGR